MKIHPIRKVRVYEQVIEQIKELIKDGVITPGNKLPSERELATEFSVSRTVVREAMSVLNASGIIEIRPGIGVFLQAEDQVNLLVKIQQALQGDEKINLPELLELRQGLEGQAAFLAAKQVTPQDAQRMKLALEQLKIAVSNHEVAAEEDLSFHLSIVEASKNRIIKQMMDLILEPVLAGLLESRKKSLMLPKTPEVVVREHEEILQAILDGDGRKARDLVIYHLDNVIKRSYLSL